MTARDDFRNAVFTRDQNACVACDAPAVDAHHIIERRLFPDGGYDIDNGASVCEEHHLEAEATVLDCVTLRDMCGISRVVLPPHMYSDNEYTKWGDIINDDGTRTPGELFEDASVQKILGLGNKLHLYTSYRKYPRTYHLPWSPGLGDDDRVLPSTGVFDGHAVVITEKMDGENMTIYWDGYSHARSLTSSYHPSRERTKALAAALAWQLPHGWRVCGENLTAVHSIKYNDLPSFFLLFSIWNEKNECLSWEDTEEWAQLLNLITVPVLIPPTTWSEEHVKSLQPRNESEGYVVRIADKFHYRDFRQSVAKYVRPNHVRATHNWLMKPVEFNEWRKE